MRSFELAVRSPTKIRMDRGSLSNPFDTGTPSINWAACSSEWCWRITWLVTSAGAEFLKPHVPAWDSRVSGLGTRRVAFSMALFKPSTRGAFCHRGHSNPPTVETDRAFLATRIARRADLSP